MSIQYGKLCSLLLSEHFGETVEKVGRDLFRGGHKPLKSIVNSTQLGMNRVRQALCILIQYGLVSFTPGKAPNCAEYGLKSETVILLLRYPKYLMLVKTLYGNEAEIIVEEILRVGADSVSPILLRAFKRIAATNENDDKKGTLLPQLKTTFETLVNKQYIMRCPLAVKGDEGVPTLLVESENMFKPPRVDVAQLQSAEGEMSNDGGVTWRVNFDRFHQDMRDDLLVAAMSRRVAPPAGDVMQAMLKQMYLNSEAWAPVSNPVVVSHLKDVMRKSKCDVNALKHVEDYLAVMAEDPSQFLLRADSAHLAYHVNVKQAIQEMTWCVLCAAVEVKFGTNAGRIFRLVHQQEFIEQEEIQKRAMLPDKEAKLLTYSLLHAGWIRQHELKKGLQKAGPTKTFYLFHVNMDQVVRMYVETCYKSLCNAITRREHERSENKCLLDKKQRIDTIALHMRKEGATEDQVQEIVEMVTPPERQLLDKIHVTVGRLAQAEVQVDETLFILQLYLAAQCS